MFDPVRELMEHMLPEFRDMAKNKLFTKAEIRRIAKKREGFERALLQRKPPVSAFLRYVEYEADLARLLVARKGERGVSKKAHLPCDVAGLRHMHGIYQRAVNRHRDEPELWLAFIDFAMRTGAAKSVGKLFAKALQALPRNEGLWILAAAYEFQQNHNIFAARALLHRAIRLLPTSRPLCTQLAQLELQYIARLLDGMPAEAAEQDPVLGAVLRGAMPVHVFKATAVRFAAAAIAAMVTAGIAPPAELLAVAPAPKPPQQSTDAAVAASATDDSVPLSELPGSDEASYSEDASSSGSEGAVAASASDSDMTGTHLSESGPSPSDPDSDHDSVDVGDASDSAGSEEEDSDPEATTPLSISALPPSVRAAVASLAALHTDFLGLKANFAVRAPGAAAAVDEAVMASARTLPLVRDHPLFLVAAACRNATSIDGIGAALGAVAARATALPSADCDALISACAEHALSVARATSSALPQLLSAVAAGVGATPGCPPPPRARRSPGRAPPGGATPRSPPTPRSPS
jgi:hypothetical protein